eukprot:5992363-Alexandrium_andersonii.AAC.1
MAVGRFAPTGCSFAWLCLELEHRGPKGVARLIGKARGGAFWTARRANAELADEAGRWGRWKRFSRGLG